MAVSRKWSVVLRDLVSFGEIGIEIILARENGGGMDTALERERGTDGQFDDVLVEDRKGTRKTETDWTDVRVRRSAKVRGTATKGLGSREQLYVHLETNHHLVRWGLRRRRR